MKRALLLLGLLVSCPLWLPQVLAQASRWQWAGAQPFTVNAVAADAQGNIYATGHFRGTITLGKQLLVCAHTQYDLLVAKYNPQGEVLWAAALPAQPRYPGQVSGLFASGTDISLGPGGEAYVVGSMQGELPAALGSSAPDMTEKFVVVKVSAAGQPQWAVQGSLDPYPVRAAAIATDAQGNCYLTGRGPFRLSNSTVQVSGWRQMFVLSLDAAGHPRWAMQSGATYACVGTDIGVDAQNGVYVTGTYTGPLTFGGVPLARTSGQLVARLNASTGQVLWARGDEGAYDHLAVDATGHCYAAGLFRDSLRLGGQRLMAGAAIEGYVARFSPGGGVDWLRSVGVAAAFSEADVALADGQPTVLLKRTASTAAVVALLANGSLSWEQTATGIDGNPRLATVPGAGPLRWVLGGALAGPAGFGPWPLLPAGGATGFVAELAQPAVLTTPPPGPAATLQVYPNPTRTRLQWRLSADGAVEAQLLDAKGRLVGTVRSPAQRGTAAGALDVGSLARGLYLLRVSSGSTVRMARVQLE